MSCRGKTKRFQATTEPSRVQAYFSLITFAAFAAVWCLRTQAIAAASPTTQPADVRSAIGLRSCTVSGTMNVGQLRRELFRQAVLIAARDGLGMETRDESLRQPLEQLPPSQTLTPDMADLDLSLRVGAQPEKLWQARLTTAQRNGDLAVMAKRLEGSSRTDFLYALRRAGWSPNASPAKPSAPPPADAESRLAKLEILSEFYELRETHALIRSDGESPERLGVLVRGYANLGQITRFHWSLENKVFSARALLYANRMVANQPDDPVALWHRACALALAGLQNAALDDIDAARKLDPNHSPEWAPLLEPYCKYQTNQLIKLAADVPSQAPLAMYLAFVTVEDTAFGCNAAPLAIGQAALKANPLCLQLIDSMCDRTGPGLLNELNEEEPRIFSQTLGDELEDAPGLPVQMAHVIDAARDPERNPQGREMVCRALIKEGTAAKDSGEPSWDTLGRLIQETTFAQIRRNAEFIAVHQGGDALDFAMSSRPLIPDHPYRAVVEAYGVQDNRHSKSVDDALKNMSIDDLGIIAFPLHRLLQSAELAGSDGAQKISTAIHRNADPTSFDLEKLILSYREKTNNTFIKHIATRLRRTSSASPLLVALSIRDDWDNSKPDAPGWEASLSDQPTVMLALGKKYVALKQWSDAERCLRKYIALSPDRAGYEQLADVFLSQNQEDLWLKTLQEYIDTAPDFDLNHAAVQVEIANHFMDKLDYYKAIPYADAAATTGAEWAINCSARAHDGIGDRDTARKLRGEANLAYSRGPISLYEACIRDGQGDRAGTAAASRADFAARDRTLVPEELLRWATLEMLEKNDALAIKLWQRRMDALPGPHSALHIAILADAAHDNVARDAALKQIPVLPNQTSPLFQFAAILRTTIAAGPDALPDAAAIDHVMMNADPQQQITVCYLTARFLETRGYKDQATPYLRRCCIGQTASHGDVLLAYDALRARGIDPTEVEKAATQPSER
jgi:tetratricopeptide (TPR) repeat protein